MSSNSSKGKGCHSAKCRRAFLHESIKNGNSKDVKSYFKLMGRLGAKDARFTKYLQSDLKYFVQRGGDGCNFETKDDCKEPCIWDEDVEMCYSAENANFTYNPATTTKEYTEAGEKALEESKRQYEEASAAVNRYHVPTDKINAINKLRTLFTVNENTLREYTTNPHFTPKMLNKIYNTIKNENKKRAEAELAELAALEAGNT